MSWRPLDSWVEVGRRIADARAEEGWTQTRLADELGLDRTAITKLEAGTRALSSLELARLAAALDRPIEWFVSESPPSVVSRRAEFPETADSIGRPVDAFARDVELLIEVKALPSESREAVRWPETVEESEQIAAATRKRLGRPDGPLTDLGAAVGAWGLHVLSMELPGSADGAYVALDGAGAAVINGSQPAGRRRFTLAHEFGHHVLADEYSTDWAVGESRDERERRINAFAVHLLLPRPSITRDWERLGGPMEPRSAAIRLAAEYRVSWSAVTAQLINLDLLDKAAAETLRQRPPTKAEHLELGLFIVEELASPYVSPLFVQAVLRAYSSGRIAQNRALELLRGTLAADELPAVDVPPAAALKGELA